jgi:glycosyltransferase involved in cell wall biosynthesis
MGLLFYPRGGSAHVARNLAKALPHVGWDATILSGSVSVPGHPGDAGEFYRGLDVRPVDMTLALSSPDPMAGHPPLHPSYEDRPGAPDRMFGLLDDEDAEHQVATWARALQSVDAAGADVLHLHHLTPLYEAAARVAPNVPIVGHLHGTELMMLEEIEADPHRWPYGLAWAERLRGWAAACQKLIVLTETQVDRAERLLGIDADRCVLIPNGFDPDYFGPRHLDHRALWRRMLVDEPRGWAPREEPGSPAPHARGGATAYLEPNGDLMRVRYRPEVLDAFCERSGDERSARGGTGETPVLLYVGRYTEVKRIPLLIEAYERARPGFNRRAPLVIVGGFPGEWEGEHPLETIRRVNAQDVFLAGWHEHHELADILAATDVIVLPSVREQFGQVLVEGMACGLPAIAVDAYGPADIVEHGETGWLVEPDDLEGLTNALVESVNRPDERRRRGAAAAEDVAERFAWPALARQVAALYDEVRDGVLSQA